MPLPAPRRFQLLPGKLANPATATPRVLRVSQLPAQGYRLRVTAGGITIEAADAAGEFYGRMTLRQLLRESGNELRRCEIEDWPDFPTRGVMLDISRDKVPTMPTLFAIIDELAEWKINHLELYIEHTFAYRNHREVWQNASPLTGEEIRQLDAHCRERFIELMPNQNSFGHFERWLQHPRYRHLAAGEKMSCLDPKNCESLALLEELYDELLPNFASRKFNVGCDETWGIEGRDYLEFLKQIHALVQRRDRMMYFWGDIILHHPELVAELPRDVVVLEWGYEAEHPFDQHGALFAKSGLPFFVCPGTSSWNSIAGRTENCLANLRAAATQGRQHGAVGYLNTDWGDNGHWQYWPVSYLGLAAGAAFSWCGETNAPGGLMAALDQHVFRDTTGVMARVAYDLGNAYREISHPMRNASALFHLLFQPATHPIFAQMERERLEATSEFVEKISRRLGEAQMGRPDAALIRDEFANAGRMLGHGCRRAIAIINKEPVAPLAAEMREILAEHRHLWLARNRPGGLADSTRVLKQRLQEYEGATSSGAIV